MEVDVRVRVEMIIMKRQKTNKTIKQRQIVSIFEITRIILLDFQQKNLLKSPKL